MLDNKNTSGHGKMADVPNEVKGWSWGAFLLTWIWGLGNSTYRAFWCFVPIVNIFMWITLGIKGREWAWRNRRWESVEQFKRVQKRWGIAGFIIILVLACLYAATFLGVFTILNNAAPTKMTIQYVQQNSQFQQVLGAPIKRSGTAQGEFSTKGGHGFAQMHFTITGSKSSGQLSYQACEVNNKWYLYSLNYADAYDQSNNIQLEPESSAQCSDS